MKYKTFTIWKEYTGKEENIVIPEFQEEEDGQRGNKYGYNATSRTGVTISRKK